MATDPDRLVSDRTLATVHQRKSCPSIDGPRKNSVFYSQRKSIGLANTASITSSATESERSLRCSQATINLQSDDLEVEYGGNARRISGRKSSIQATSKLSALIKNRLSMMSMSDDGCLPEYQEISRISSEDGDIRYSSMNPQYDGDSNEVSRTSSLLESSSVARSSSSRGKFHFKNRTPVRKSNSELVKARNTNPEERKRPTSAGHTNQKNYSDTSLMYNDDHARQNLSDTEVDDMTITVRN